MNLPRIKTIEAAARRAALTAATLGLALSISAQERKPDPAAGRSPSAASARQAGATASSLKEAAELNLATIAFAEIAAERANNPELKRFGQSLRAHHSEAQERLKAIAEKHNVTLPTELDKQYEAQLTKLRDLSGAAFDREYMKGAVEGYATALVRLQTQLAEKQDGDVAQYTRQIQGYMRDALQKSRQLAKDVGLDPTTVAAMEGVAKDSAGTPGNTTESAQGGGKEAENGR